MAETLTSEQIAYVRAMTGDDCTPYDVGPEFMQYLYDNQASTAPLCMSGDPLGGLVLWVLRARLAKAVKLFDETDSGDGTTRKLSQKYEHLEKQVSRQETACGLGGGIITVGTFDLGLDAECPPEYASYYHRWSWGGYL